MENKESFNYMYSAKEQKEIMDIRKKYAAPEEAENKMEQLRRLDAGVYSKATAASLVVGVIGALVMGLGMSLVMTDIGSTLGLNQPMVQGIIIGIVGMIMGIVNYPIYKSFLSSRRKKYADEILKLSEKIMK